MSLPVGASAPCPLVDPDNPGVIRADALGDAGGGVTHHTDGLLAQAANVAVGAATEINPVTWLAVLPDGDANVTHAAGNFTVANDGLYEVSLYGRWVVDNSVELDERLIRFAVDNVAVPAAQGIYAWAQGRECQNLVPPATFNLTGGKMYFSLDFTAFFSAGDAFHIEAESTDAATATELDLITLSIVKIA